MSVVVVLSVVVISLVVVIFVDVLMSVVEVASVVVVFKTLAKISQACQTVLPNTSIDNAHEWCTYGYAFAEAILIRANKPVRQTFIENCMRIRIEIEREYCVWFFLPSTNETFATRWRKVSLSWQASGFDPVLSHVDFGTHLNKTNVIRIK